MQRKFKANLKIKIFSFMFAFIMWIYVMSEVDPIVIRSFESIPIESIVNIDEIRDDGLTFAYGQNFNAKIDFRAKRSTLNEYIRNGVKPKGEIYDPTIGTNTMTIVLDTPREIEYSVVPEKIEVILEKSLVSLKDVYLETEGELQNGYVVREIIPNRNKLYVEGPQSQVEKVNNLLSKIKLENQNSDFSSKVNLIPVDSKGHVVEGVTVRDANIIVDVSVDKIKSVPIELVFVNSENKVIKNSSFESEIKMIEIQGRESLVNKIESIKTKPIKISNFNITDGLLYPLENIEGLKLSDNKIKVVPLDDKIIQYDLSIPKEDVKFLGTYEVENLKEKLPESLEIKLFAGQEYKDLIESKKITLFIDNYSQKEEYKLSYKIDVPIASIKVTPDVINLPKNN